jgi:hypothetical protein
MSKKKSKNESPPKEKKKAIDLPYVEVDSWVEVLDSYYSALYHMDTGLREAATIAAATLLTIRIPGDPLWLFVVGPPSTGKTVIVDSLAADTVDCESISKLTAKTLISGWKDSENPERDVSIFPLLKDRALLIKDFTTVLAMSGSVKEDLFGTLRDCYDGYVKIPYGNGVVREYNDIYFPMVAAVTDVIKGENLADMGERFLRVEILGPGHDEDAIMDAAMDDFVKGESRKERLRMLGGAISSFLHKIPIDLENLPTHGEEIKTKIKALSRVIGHVRAVVKRQQGDLVYRVRPEGASRVSKQLKKLGVGLALLLQKNSIDEDAYWLLRKTGLDTVQGLALEVTQSVLHRDGKVVTTDRLTDILRLPKTSVVRHLNDLQEIGVLENYKVSNSLGTGRDSYAWRGAPEFRSLWLEAGLNPTRRITVV